MGSRGWLVPSRLISGCGLGLGAGLKRSLLAWFQVSELLWFDQIVWMPDKGSQCTDMDISSWIVDMIWTITWNECWSTTIIPIDVVIIIDNDGWSYLHIYYAKIFMDNLGQAEALVKEKPLPPLIWYIVFTTSWHVCDYVHYWMCLKIHTRFENLMCFIIK